MILITENEPNICTLKYLPSVQKVAVVCDDLTVLIHRKLVVPWLEFKKESTTCL